MKNVIVLTGSVRPNSASTQVAKLVEAELMKHENVSAKVVEVGELNLPFFNAPVSPSAEGYEATDENVKAWESMVEYADAVVWVMPEYNNSISAVQKNAIDWLYAEWKDKPLSVVGYGWYGGANVLKAIESPIRVLKPDVRSTVGLGFMKQIEVDGTLKDQAGVDELLVPAINDLLAESSNK